MLLGENIIKLANLHILIKKKTLNTSQSNKFFRAFDAYSRALGQVSEKSVKAEAKP